MRCRNHRRDTQAGERGEPRASDIARKFRWVERRADRMGFIEKLHLLKSVSQYSKP